MLGRTSAIEMAPNPHVVGAAKIAYQRAEGAALAAQAMPRNALRSMPLDAVEQAHVNAVERKHLNFFRTNIDDTVISSLDERTASKAEVSAHEALHRSTQQSIGAMDYLHHVQHQLAVPSRTELRAIVRTLKSGKIDGASEAAKRFFSTKATVALLDRSFQEKDPFNRGYELAQLHPPEEDAEALKAETRYTAVSEIAELLDIVPFIEHPGEWGPLMDKIGEHVDRLPRADRESAMERIQNAVWEVQDTDGGFDNQIQAKFALYQRFPHDFGSSEDDE